MSAVNNKFKVGDIVERKPGCGDNGGFSVGKKGKIIAVNTNSDFFNAVFYTVELQDGTINIGNAEENLFLSVKTSDGSKQSIPEGGVKHDTKKPDMSLIPSMAELEEAGVWTFGKQKYSAFNWHKGINFSRILGAIQRHAALLKAGIDFDHETNRHHAAAIRCGCAMLIQFTAEGRTELDDRIKLNESTKSLVIEMSNGESIFDILKELKEQ